MRKIRDLLRKRKPKKFFKKGAGEAMGFIIASPVLIMVFALLVSIIQVGMIDERLEYIAYSACRKAVTAKNYKTGAKTAEKYMESEIGKAGLKYEEGSESITLYITGTAKKPEDYTKKDLQKWKKGAYVQCTVRVSVTPPMVFVNGKRSSTVVMMIENPAAESGTTPWFDFYRK